MVDIEQRIIAEAARRVKLNPSRCSLRILAETILELDLDKRRVLIESHKCPEEPRCPEAITRTPI